MIIYIVWYSNFDGVDEFHSAHSTEEKAQARIEKYAVRDRTEFRVEPYTLDEE